MLRRLVVGAACMLAELIFLGPRPRAPQPEHVRSSLLRQREPYFSAFLGRCLASVYASTVRAGDE